MTLRVSPFLKFRPCSLSFIQYRFFSDAPGGRRGNRTCLYDFHKKHGGKIVSFAGWEMPVQYSDLSVLESTIHTRNCVSIFDVSHMLQTKIYGKDRIAFFESLVTGDVEGLGNDRGVLTLFTNEKGGIKDDLIVTKTSSDHLYVVTNAGCIEKDLPHMQEYADHWKNNKGADVIVEPLHGRGLIAVQGPQMMNCVQVGLEKIDLNKLYFMHSAMDTVFGIPDCRVTRCGYTGEDGVEISVDGDRASELCEKLLESKATSVKMAGLGARDACRLEAGLCLYGNDMDETTTPAEASLLFVVSGAVIQSVSGEKVGNVTSGCPSPNLKKNIAMGYVQTGFSKIGTDVRVDITGKGDQLVEAKVLLKLLEGLNDSHSSGPNILNCETIPTPIIVRPVSDAFSPVRAAFVPCCFLRKVAHVSLGVLRANAQTDTGIGMDSSVTPLRHGGLSLVQTTDFFYPLVYEPHAMGRIACANTLSDLYAMGVVNCDNMLTLLGVSTALSESERDVIIPMMLKGFKDCATEAGTSVQGGQTVKNPCLIIGGVASSVCDQAEYIMPDNAVAGDVLLLTKPLGTQVAVNVYEWIENPKMWAKVSNIIDREEATTAYDQAVESMCRLNRTAARLMHKYGAHGATDVTGFGILGHAQNLARVQKNDVSFVIHNLPIIAKMKTVSNCVGIFGLVQGISAETSGGLLVVLPREQAAAFCKEIEKTEGFPAWIVGVVEKGNRTAKIIDSPRIIEVTARIR